MANVQGTVYGHSDCWGIPFDFYSGAAALPTGATINMQTGILILNPAGAVSVTINLPLNPPDGAVSEITNVSTANAVTLTAVNANTGDVIVGAALPATLTVEASTPGVTNGIKYKYTLNGCQVGNTFVNPRTWLRVQ
jgi:hypothetical protein